MPKQMFISYSHHEVDWVMRRLVPCLKAGGREPLFDRHRFEAGRALFGQMDALQDSADGTILVLSPQYLESRYCCREMERAIDRDPGFEKGSVIPVLRVECPLPDSIESADPLCVDLRDDSRPEPWDLLLSGCGVDLGTSAPRWLAAREELQLLLGRGQSVNLVVLGRGVAWLPLMRLLELPGLEIVDLQMGRTAGRRGLVREVLQSLGFSKEVPPEPEDLAELDRILDGSEKSWLGLAYADLIPGRDYGVDFFAALRYHLTETRRLVLLVQSRRPFATLLPVDHPLSSIDVKTVELRGRT